MRRATFITLLFIVAFAFQAEAQRTRTIVFKHGYATGYDIMEGDTVQCCTIAPVYIFAKARDMRQYQRLVRNVKIVYPIAKEARMYFDSLTVQLADAHTDRQREQLTKAMEKRIVKRYTPVLQEMTYSQGKILIKLIDRETNRTSYQLLRDFRGKFSAGFWNTVARLFKANLKEGYDKKGEDRLIEQIIILYEAGLL